MFHLELRMNRCVLWSVLVLVPAIMASGCGKSGREEVKKVPVSGTVNQDGKPMATGKITFKNKKTTTTDVVDIKDGKFSGEAAPGQARVEITNKRETKEKNPVGGMEPATISEELIAPEFNSKSTLTATVGDSGATDLKFDVKSK